MLIGDLFLKDVTRAIPPVVYFHEQAPDELQREVEEYIITGGYPKDDPRATEGGIHEQFVRLLGGIRRELDKPGGPELPACWISGFYGSGKSSFAKLLGLAFDGRLLPNGRSLADALLDQDHSRDKDDFKRAWAGVLEKVSKPVAVVFDVGTKARDDEQIHSAVVRQVQERLGYSNSNLVAEYELKLELEKLYPAFLDKVLQIHGKPWGQLKDNPLVEDLFAAAMHALRPELFPDPAAWFTHHGGSKYEGKRAADEVVTAIQQMIEQRVPGSTLFIVIDEVSQYVHDDNNRMLALQSFVSALGQRMKGRVWLIATGQQKLEESGGAATAILKLKDRFPPSLRVHLGIANIRDVVHKRLLRKNPVVESDLAGLYQKHRADLSLYAYRGEELDEASFVEVYPMLPGYIGLLLDITSGMRSRSSRAQGDSHAIRGLLQLLGDLFREKELARYEVGRLISIDLIYDVLHSALEADVQLTLSRALDFCAREHSPLMTRVVKAISLLELVQDHQKTSAELIARCLYESLGQGNLLPEVQQALDALKGEGLVGYSESTGYKIESSAGQEWQRERDGYSPDSSALSDEVKAILALLVADVEKPKLTTTSGGTLPIPWLALYSDNVGNREVHIKDERKYTVVAVDFQFTKGDDAELWVPLSDTKTYKDRIVWVAGEVDSVRHAATTLLRSKHMIDRYEKRESTLPDEKARLLREERNRRVTAESELKERVKAAFMDGPMFFRGKQTHPKDIAASFTAALDFMGKRTVSTLYPHPTACSVYEKDIEFLIDKLDLGGPPAAFEQLGILSLEANRYEITCQGRVPTDVLNWLKEQKSTSGTLLLEYFGRPPYGTPPDVLRAVVVGLLRAGRIKVELPEIGELTSVRDAGVRELIKDTGLRKSTLIFRETVGPTQRELNAICQMFHDALQVEVARNTDAIHEAVTSRFAAVRERLTSVAERFRHLPRTTPWPEALTRLEKALESCRRDRKVEPTLQAVTRNLPALRDGVLLLRRMETDLTEATADTLRQAEDVLRTTWPGLQSLGASEEVRAAANAMAAHLAKPRPWEEAAELIPQCELVRGAYRARRRAILDAHGEKIELLAGRLKLRDGFDKLDMDQRHQVLRHLSEGAQPGTDERAVAPPIEALEALLAAKRESAESRALAQLDSLLNIATVEVVLNLSGRELKTESELDHLLQDLRQRVLRELQAKRRVRLK